MQIKMDINQVNPNSVAERRLEQARADEKSKKADGITPDIPSDKGTESPDVRLSEKARSLANAQAGEPAFDQARVESIRSAIAEGRYPIDPQRLAERFVALESQLGDDQ